MKKTIISCDICDTKEAIRWSSIFLPTTTAGGDAVQGWHELCWDCYAKVCYDLTRVFKKYEK